MASVLTIAGSSVSRPPNRLILNRLTLSLDRPDELEFTEICVNLPGSYHPEQAVTLTIDGTLSFTGWIFSRSPVGYTQQAGAIGYRCIGLRYGAYLLPVTAADGTGLMQFNVPRTDEDNYVASLAGQSIGNILTTVWGEHSAQLGAMGIATDATTTTQLAALTVVPPEPVYIQGNNLWGQCEQLLHQWYASKYALWITPAGKIRVSDTTSLTAKTLTFGTDPVILGSLSEDTSECYTQVCMRGGADVQPYKASLSEGTLIDPNDPTPESTWKLSDFRTPTAGYSEGNITSQTSTTVTITSDRAAETWPSNYWSGIQAEIGVINPAITGAATLTGGEWKRITSNTALTAGGSSVITVDSPFANTGYTRYEIRGTPPGISESYRRYTFKWRYVGQHLVPKFNHSVFWNPSEGVGMDTLFPQSEVVSAVSSINASLTRVSRAFDLVLYDGVTDGYVRFLEPTVKGLPGNSDDVLAAGGAGVTKPTDVIVLVPYSRGALQAIEPLSGGTPTYGGTAYTRFGIQRTLYRDYPGWIDAGNLADMQTLASAILDTVKDVVIDGSVTYLGKYTDALIGGSWPICLNLAKDDATIGYESMGAPVRTVVLEYPQEGATAWRTHLSFSTKRQLYSGDRLYVHPTYTGSGKLFGGMEGMLAPTGMSVTGPGWDQSLAYSPVGTGQAGAGPLGVSQAGMAYRGAQPEDTRTEGDRQTTTPAAQAKAIAKQQAEAEADMTKRRTAQGLGPGGFAGQAGFGYGAAGTLAPDVSGITQFYAGMGMAPSKPVQLPKAQQLPKPQNITDIMGTAQQFRQRTTGQRPKDWAD